MRYYFILIKLLKAENYDNIQYFQSDGSGGNMYTLLIGLATGTTPFRGKRALYSEVHSLPTTRQSTSIHIPKETLVFCHQDIWKRQFIRIFL